MDRRQHNTPSPPLPRDEDVDGAGAGRDRPQRHPSSVDSVLESIGKAVTEPIRDASEDEPGVPDRPGAGRGSGGRRAGA